MGDRSPRDRACDDWFNPVISTVTQVSSILVISHFFHILLKPIGQPGPVAQILAGFVIGPSGLSKIAKIENFFFLNSAIDHYETMMLYARIIIMFQIGLEMDFPFLRRDLRPAGIIAFSNCFMCTIFAAAVTPFVEEEDAHGTSPIFTIGIMITVPKPRRLGLINPASIEPIWPLRRHFSYQQEVDAKAGAELKRYDL